VAELNGDGWWRGVSVRGVETRAAARFFPSAYVDEASQWDPMMDLMQQ
jgi:hypothetical protein